MYGGKFYPDYLTVGGCSLAIQRTAIKWCKGTGLDIGAGYWPLEGATPIDDARGRGMRVCLEDVAAGSQDYVFSSHCLEHILDWKSALVKWISKVRCGGYIFLYLPHPSCMLWHRSNPFMSKVHVWVPSAQLIVDELAHLGLQLESRDDGPDPFFSFYVCARKMT